MLEALISFCICFREQKGEQEQYTSFCDLTQNSSTTKQSAYVFCWNSVWKHSSVYKTLLQLDS